MDAIDWDDAAGWAGVVVAVLAAVVAVIAAKQAHGSANRSAAAAERSADADQRMVALAEAEATKYRVPWRISQAGNARYLLHNDGDEVAHNVSIQGDFVDDSPVEYQQVGPRESVEFFAPRGYGDKDDRVTVHWYRYPGQGGDRQVWHDPLP